MFGLFTKAGLTLFLFLSYSIEASAAPATEAEIADLYRTVLGREKDQDGADFWKKSGLSKEEIKAEFYKSDEFKNMKNKSKRRKL